MKLNILLIIITIISAPVFAEWQGEICGVPNDTSLAVDRTQMGGLLMTSTGVFKILVVFARFPDDNDIRDYWPVNGDPVGWESFLDPDENVNTLNLSNITSYFSEMSYDNFEVIGDVISVTTPQNESAYSTNREAANDLLQNAVDTIVDFSDYDNWTRNSAFDHSNVPDGEVDLIIIVWRKNPSWWGNIAGWNTTWADTFTADGVLVSDLGATVFYYKSYNMTRIRAIAVHEMGHHLIGPHPYANDQHFSIWGLLSNPYHSGSCANSFEREQLGWINLIDVTDVNAAISDYLTTGVAYRYHPINGEPDEYYYIENHQKTNIFDDATVESGDKGIFILHARGVYNGTNNIEVITSEGFYDIDNPEWVENVWDPTGDLIPGYRILSENGLGYSKRERIPYSNPPPGFPDPGKERLYALYQSPGNYQYGGFFKGAHSITSYNLTTRTVFSPWSNPPANIWESPSSSAGFSMEIQNESNGIITVHFYTNNPDDSKPAKPMNFSAVNQGGYPYLSWNANNEPDIAGYKLYKTVSPFSGNPQTFIITLPSSTTTYTDLAFPIGGKRPTDMVTFYIKAYDTQNKYSDETVNYSFIGTNLIRWKQLTETEIPKQYSIKQNYPNPFNPSTSIRFDLPERSRVIMVIYDVLGRTVKTLIQNTMEPGFHEIRWDGKDDKGNPVSTGMYIYRFSAFSEESEKQFNKSNKLVLMK